MAGQGPWGSGGSGGSGGDKGGGEEPPRDSQRPGRPWGSPQPPPERPGQQEPPSGPRRPGSGHDLDDLVRQGQERLRVLMGGRGGGGRGGRGGGGPGRGGSPINRFTIGIAALAAIVIWVVASFYSVTTGSKSVELLFGRPIAVKDEGLNLAPWPVVTKEIVDVSSERVTEIGTGQGGELDTGLMLTRDQNIVDMVFQVVWNISNPEDYLFNLADPEGTIRAVSESAMRDIVARSELAPILNRDRGMIARDLEIAVQQTLDSYEAGIHVARVNLGRADPPSEVIDAFRDVQAAQQERDRLEKEADAYANRVLAEARGEAAALVEQSQAYRAQVVNIAEGEAARFESVYGEYVKAPEVTRQRIYLETMEEVLGGVNKVLISGDAGKSVLPYLPLDALRPGQQTGPARAASGRSSDGGDDISRVGADLPPISGVSAPPNLDTQGGK